MVSAVLFSGKRRFSAMEGLSLLGELGQICLLFDFQNQRECGSEPVFLMGVG